MLLLLGKNFAVGGLVDTGLRSCDACTTMVGGGGLPLPARGLKAASGWAGGRWRGGWDYGRGLFRGGVAL